MKPVRFEVVHRDWNPMPGTEDQFPDEPVFVLRCLDTDIITCDADLQRAYNKLLAAKEAKEKYEAS